MNRMSEGKAWSGNLFIAIFINMVNRVNEHLKTYIKNTIRVDLYLLRRSSPLSILMNTKMFLSKITASLNSKVIEANLRIFYTIGRITNPENPAR